MRWTLSKQTLRACAFFALCAVSSLAQAVTITVPSITVQPGTNVSMPLTATITGGSENIAGLEFGIEVMDPSGRITLTTLNLKPAGGLFAPFATSQSATESSLEVRPGEFRELFRQIVLNVDDSTDPPTPVFAPPNGTKGLASFTLKIANPLPGNYALVASQTSLHTTRVADDSQDDAVLNDVQFINGMITVVPEPSTILMAGFAGIGLVLYGFRRSKAA
jgi:hypothetical protein